MAKNPGEKTWLLNIRSSNYGLHEYVLKPGHNYIGRQAENDFILLDNAASSHHAGIYYDQNTNSVTIWDFDSTNGTFVNGKRINNYHVLQHEDQIRIGHSLISVTFTNKAFPTTESTWHTPTKVTDELILESIDQYGVLLHEIGQRLISMPDLGTAITEIVEMIKRMIEAEDCKVILADKFENLNEFGIPISFAQKTIDNQSATIFSNASEDLSENNDPATQPLQSMLLVPVIIELRVVALIFAKKSRQVSRPFNNSDLQLTLAVSNQVAMSIQRSWVEGVLMHNSNHDSLTDLPNRALFLERLKRSIERSKQRNGVGFAVLFFDIDDFKVVNDSLGHAIGDKLLIAVAERIKHNIRNIDIVAQNSLVARFGGDEFAILLDNIGESQPALATANRLNEILSKPFNIMGKQIFSTVSVGVAVSTIGYENPDDILRDADMAMYRAKELGKARVEVYDTAMHDLVSERMHMGTVLRQGALEKEFRLHYQPVISLQSGCIVGYEALVRWYTPDRGVLNPVDFMDAIDTTGLIYSTDHWVLQNACIQAVKWGNKFPNISPLFMSVNLSAKNIKHPNLIDNVNQVLQETKLNPDRLWIEITEKVSAPDDTCAIEVLRKLRSFGIRVCLDDFGTGYSALNYLARFPVDVLKIDRSFINTIGADDDSQKIIEMIQALANHLGLVVIAEGVETKEQVAYLKSINCEYVQGYFYARPLDAQSATRLLASGL